MIALGRITVAGLVGCVACSDLTSVDAPDLVQRPDLTNTNGAIALFNGAVRQFYAGFGGTVQAGPTTNGGFISSTAVFADELSAAAPSVGLTDLDRRTAPEGMQSFVYPVLQSSRISQLQALRVVRQVIPQDRWRTAQLYGFLGYSELLLAELFCSGIPLSDISEDFKPVFGQQLTTTEIFSRALANFDSALIYAADSVRILSLARVGRGRVLANLNRHADAAAAVAGVPTNFVFTTEHSASVVPNALGALFTAVSASVADGEGLNGLNYVWANDPRVPTVAMGRGADGTAQVYRLSRISSTASPNILASGIEARLIEAEAALRAGNSSSWHAILNGLRSGAIAPPMPQLTDPGSSDARTDLMFRERAFWLFLTGHRFGDLRRLIRQYGRSPDSVFPVGAYKSGGVFGDDVTLPLEAAESVNNPLLGGKGCIDRNA